MKTLRYRIGNDVKPGILDIEENIRDASSLVSDWDSNNVTVEKLSEIKNIDIVKALELPPIKIHCSVLAEDSIKQAIEDYEQKQ